MKWIIIEGLDGSGKTTAINFLKEHYESKGKTVALIRAIGSGSIGEVLRKFVIEQEYTDTSMNTLAFPVAIMDAISEVFEAVHTHDVVIMDRYLGSYFAYEDGSNDELVLALVKYILEYQKNLLSWIEPTNVFIYATAEQCVNRIESRGNKQFSDFYDKDRQNKILDRFGKLYSDFYKDPNRVIINNSGSLEMFEQALLNFINHEN